MPLWAIIFRIWPDEPVFHRLRLGSTTTTSCGRTVGMHLPLLPMKHAIKFGRPCRGCFQDK